MGVDDRQTEGCRCCSILFCLYMCPCLYIIQGQLPFTFVITMERSNYLADADRSMIRLFALFANIFLTGGVTVGGGQHKPIYRKHFQKNFFLFSLITNHMKLRGIQMILYRLTDFIQIEN